MYFQVYSATPSSSELFSCFRSKQLTFCCGSETCCCFLLCNVNKAEGNRPAAKKGSRHVFENLTPICLDLEIPCQTAKQKLFCLPVTCRWRQHVTTPSLIGWSGWRIFSKISRMFHISRPLICSYLNSECLQVSQRSIVSFGVAMTKMLSTDGRLFTGPFLYSERIKDLLQQTNVCWTVSLCKSTITFHRTFNAIQWKSLISN